MKLSLKTLLAIAAYWGTCVYILVLNALCPYLFSNCNDAHKKSFMLCYEFLGITFYLLNPVPFYLLQLFVFSGQYKGTAHHQHTPPFNPILQEGGAFFAVKSFLKEFITHKIYQINFSC